jgi:outer membrane protein assembly factor BamB
MALAGLFFLGACSHLNGTSEPEKAAPAASSADLQISLKKVWVRPTGQTTDVGYRKNVRMTPVVLKDKVIQGNAYDGVVAVNRTSGQVLWRIAVTGGVEGGVTIINDYLFFGGNDGHFYSASAVDGKVLWRIPVRSETLAAPLLEDGVVYFLTGNNVLHAVDALDGHELWIYTRVDSQNFSIRGASMPAYKDGAVLLGFSDGYLVSLNAKSGALKWETSLNKNKRFRDIDSTPVIDGSLVYVTGYDSHLYCVNVQTGELVWKAEPGGFGKVLLVGEKLFYSSSKGEVLAIDKKNGSTLWKFKLSEGIATSPVLFKNYLAFGESQGALRLLELETGREVAHLSPGHGIFSPIAVDEAANDLFFISNSALLYKVEAKWKNMKEDIPWLL